MRCVICDHNEWENVDQYRLKPAGMAICKHCGFISYPDKWKSPDDIKKYYRQDYRNPPRVNNWFSGQRKLHYHNAFLADLFNEWKGKGIDKPVMCEVGAAYGLFLNFLKNHFPEGEFHGTELTLSYRRNAFHEFGLSLTEEFDSSRKYDFIASYKVAEHQIDVDKLLRQYVECLKPGGVFYIGVPTWFGRLNNFGAQGFDLEYYYHPNHINVWTKKQFESLLQKVGLKAIKYNGTYYDDTYLCVRDDSVMSAPREFEPIDKMKERLAKVKTAGVAFMEGRFEEALKIWPDFPEAHISRYETKRAEYHRMGFDAIKREVIEVAISSCPGSAEAFGLAADIHMRYDRFEEAIKLLETHLRLRPGNPGGLRSMGDCFRALAKKSLMSADLNAASAYTARARDVSRYLMEVSDEQRWSALTSVYDDNSKIPTPYEARN